MENTKKLVVLPFSQGPSQGKEIHLCLRGWRKYCLFDYHFVVIGEFDAALQKQYPWVEFINCPKIPKKEKQYNQHLDVQHCMEVVMNKYVDTYDGFIWIADDNYAIKPFGLTDITTIHYHVFYIGDSHAPIHYWNYDKWKTHQLLYKEEMPHLNYTTHFPCWFDFAKLNFIWNRFKMRDESYVLEDVYFNFFNHMDPIKDDEIRLGIWNMDIFKRDFQNAVNNPCIKFVCNSVDGWSADLEKALERICY